MFDPIKLQMLSLYMDNPCLYFPRSLWKMSQMREQCATNIDFEDDIPNEISIRDNNHLVFYWNRKGKFRLDSSYINSLNTVVIHESYYNEYLSKFFLIDHMFYRLNMNLTQSVKSLLLNDYVIHTINTNDDKYKLLNLLSAIFSIDHIDLNDFLESRLKRDKLWIIMNHKDSGLPVGLGVANFDPILSEGIIELVYILPKYQTRGLEKIIISELINRLMNSYQPQMITCTINNGDLIQVYKSCGFNKVETWYILSKRLGDRI